MARRQWTLLVVSDDKARVRQLVLTRQVIQIAISAVLIVGSLLVSLGVGFFVKGSEHLRAERLQAKNELLVAEVENIRGLYSSLQATLEDLSRRDEHYRLLAGLDPLDREMMRAGIGGPGTETLQSNELWRMDAGAGALTFATAYDLNELVRRARLLASSWRDATESLTESHERLRSTPSILPTQGHLSSRFSYSRLHPLLDTPRAHQGIDISAPRGTPFVATANGRVSLVGRQGQYGLMIEIDHGHGYVTRYAHASRSLVRQGQKVSRGDVIGEVGNTGLAAGPHLHYEVLVNGRPVNPLDYIMAGEALPE